VNDAAILTPLWTAAHALYLAAAAWISLRRGGVSRARPAGAVGSARAVAVILAVGLIPRMLLLPAEPTLSEDLYRYLWDGRLVAHGTNPFLRPPSDPAFSGLRDALYDRLNHAQVPTIYPPAAQVLFAAAWALGGTPLAWKLVLFALEGALVAGLLALLARRRLPVERLLLYYWNPLVVVECYGQGHVDLAAAAFLVLALALLSAREPGGSERAANPLEAPARARWRRMAGGVAFGAAVLVKLVPLLLLPALARRRAWTALATAAAFSLLLYVPFRSAGAMLGEGLRVYARHWEFNGPIYALIRPWFRDGDAPRLALALALVGALAVIAWRARTLSGAALASWIAFLLLSPTVYPWYLIPAVALLPLHPDPGLLVLSGTIALSYLPLPVFRISGVWLLPSWILWAEYALPAALWVAAGAAALRRRPADAAGLRLGAPRG